MGNHIRTKWHKMTPLLEDDEVFLTAPSGGQGKHWSAMKGDVVVLKSLLEQWKDLPHFVFERELMGLARNTDYYCSLWDMKSAGVLRLPFPAMTVEFDYYVPGIVRGNRTIVMLRDLRHEPMFTWEFEHLNKIHPTSDFYGYRMSIENDEKGTYMSTSVSTSLLEIAARPDKQVWIQMKAFSNGVFADTKEVNDYVAATYEKDCGMVFLAACAAYLLMSTAGVAKEVVETARLNKHRAAAAKSLIPRHTYVHIGRVYRSASSDRSDEYVPRRSPRPHWRRGHIRTVHFGAGAAQVKEVYIKPKLVAYHGSSEPVTAPDYIVSK